MTRGELINYHKEKCDDARQLIVEKNTDYAGKQLSGETDVFANFRRCETLGLCTAEMGILVRLLDKISRASSFVQSGGLAVKDEQVEDLVEDLVDEFINYAILFGAIVKQGRNEHASIAAGKSRK